MKREVDSTLVEKGVAERVRLTATYERKRDELQRQHDLVKQGLDDHRAKVTTSACKWDSIYRSIFSRRPKRCSTRRRNLTRAFRRRSWPISTRVRARPAARRWPRYPPHPCPVGICAAVQLAVAPSPNRSRRRRRTRTETTLTILTPRETPPRWKRAVW